MDRPVAYWRRETPGIARGRVFLDAAGAALMPRSVVQAMSDFLRLESRVGAYVAAERQLGQCERIYALGAKLLNCHPDEIAVAESATRAWDMAFYSLPLASGDRILTSATEYGSNYLSMLQVAARTGARVEVIPSDQFGEVSAEAAASMMDERVKLIAITHVPSNGGVVNPVADIGSIATQWDVPFLLDACQSVGQMIVDVQAIGCTMLTTTSRKFLRGPRGAGLLYVKRPWINRLHPAWIDVKAATPEGLGSYHLRDDAQRFEAWETSYLTRVGFAAAIDYALQVGIPTIQACVRNLANVIRRLLSDVGGIELHDLGREPSGIVTLTTNTVQPAVIRAQLLERGITTWVSRSAAAPIDMAMRALSSLLRVSPHYYNDEEDISTFIAELSNLIRHFRS